MEKQQFQEKLTQLLRLAQEKGKVLEKGEIRDFLQELREEQYELVYAFLAEHQVRVRGYMPPRVQEAEEEGQKTEEENELELLASQSRYFAMYKKELDAIRPLTEEEEEELFRQMAAGDETARQRLAEANLRLVAETALLYKDQGVRLEDLIQEGNLGLLMGLELAKTGLDGDWRRTVTEAVMDAMEQAVYESSGSENLAKRSVAQSDLVREAVKKLEEECGKKPDLYELADYLEMETEELKDILNLSVDAIRLEEEHSHGHETEEGGCCHE